MKSFAHTVKKLKQWFQINFLEAGYLSRIKEINVTDKHSDIDTETPPEKKLCLEKSKEVTNNVRHKKVALLLSYMGDNYYGLQKADAVKTVEGELLEALAKAKCIPEEAVAKPYKINFQRTARTDKKVSAAKQIVSLVMAQNSCVETINKYLPEDIRVLSFKRVTKAFHCQNHCNGRIYSYTLPTFALAPDIHNEYPKHYRISQDIIKKTNDILLSYVGTHNFHNFTSKRSFKDPSSKRFIMSFSAEEPFIHEDEEFITLKVKGHSFMLHQIRMMVGQLIGLLKGVAPANIETSVWSEQKYNVPRAPGHGLVLEDVLFDNYNKKYENDGIHESLTFNELTDEVNNFRKKILSKIIEMEIKEKLMFQWLSVNLQVHSYFKEKIPNEENDEQEISVSDYQNENCIMTMNSEKQEKSEMTN